MLYRNRLDIGRSYRCIDQLTLGDNISLTLIPLNSLYGRHAITIIWTKSFGFQLSALPDLIMNHMSYNTIKLLTCVIHDIMYPYIQLFLIKDVVITCGSCWLINTPLETMEGGTIVGIPIIFGGPWVFFGLTSLLMTMIVDPCCQSSFQTTCAYVKHSPNLVNVTSIILDVLHYQVCQIYYWTLKISW